MIVKWEVVYIVGNTYKRKYIYADNAADAIRLARIKNIIDLNIVVEDE